MGIACAVQAVVVVGGDDLAALILVGGVGNSSDMIVAEV